MNYPAVLLSLLSISVSLSRFIIILDISLCHLFIITASADDVILASIRSSNDVIVVVGIWRPEVKRLCFVVVVDQSKQRRCWRRFQDA